MSIVTHVLCLNSNGTPEFQTFALKVNREDWENGQHYRAAKDLAEKNGYDPIQAFDASDIAGQQYTNGYQYNTTKQTWINV